MLNKENLYLAADFIERLPMGKFDMELYREDESNSITCNTVGCALGHLTGLFPDLVTFTRDGDINFWELPYTMFGITSDRVEAYCFASEWHKIDNTARGCAARLRFLADNGEEATVQKWKETCKAHNLIL